MNDALVERARQYAKIRYWLVAVDLAIVVAFLLVAQAAGWSAGLAGQAGQVSANAWMQVALFWIVGFLVFELVNLPLGWFSGFWLEHRFGLSTQRLGHWVADWLKRVGLGLALSLIVIEGGYWLLRAHPQTWWFWAAVGWLGFTVILTRVFPVLIIPLFYTCRPLGDQPLKAKLIELAGRMRIQLLDIFTIELSRKTKKANAALVGLGRHRRVLLGDTLIQQFQPDEIEVVLAHELAHHQLRHLWKHLAFSTGSALAGFFLLDQLADRLIALTGAAGLADLAMLPVLALALTMLSLILLPVQNGLSRRFERMADLVALHITGKREAFISCMQKLAEQNLADPNPPAWIEWLLYDHPSIPRRIASARL